MADPNWVIHIAVTMGITAGAIGAGGQRKEILEGLLEEVEKHCRGGEINSRDLRKLSKGIGFVAATPQVFAILIGLEFLLLLGMAFADASGPGQICREFVWALNISTILLAVVFIANVLYMIYHEHSPL